MAGTLIAEGIVMLDEAPHTEDAFRTALARLAARRVYFGHQSVGANIVEGIARLARATSVPLRIVSLEDALEGSKGAAFAHGLLGSNGAPLDKLASFAQVLARAEKAPFEVALLKLCYADITPATDARALLEHYRSTLEELRRAHPRTTFVHVTVPLVVRRRGLEALARRLLGRNDGTADNARREDYNALLREAFGTEPFFDLARFEAIAPSGAESRIVWNGRSVRVLDPSYTDDGAHLNVCGQERIARELVTLLAPVRSLLVGDAWPSAPVS